MPRMIPDDTTPTDVTEGAPDPNPPTGDGKQKEPRKEKKTKWPKSQPKG